MGLVALTLLCGCGRIGSPPSSQAPSGQPIPIQIPADEKRPLTSTAEETPPLADKNATMPPPREEIPAALREKLTALGAQVNDKPLGHGIDIRNKSDFTDREIDLVVECPQLVDLTLEKVTITDEGLKKLREASQLSRLILNDCPISGQGLKTLATLPCCDTLISLGLRGSKVNDEDLMAMQSFVHLQRLDLSKTAVTDHGLSSLEKLPLLVLNLSGTAVTDAAISQLRNKRPALTVNR
jgi:hypothetical protein